MHTPGPWMLDDELAVYAGNTKICGPIVKDDDADLIIAAPALLEALKRMYAAWNRKAPMPREDSDELEVVSRAAIAKAEGKQP